MANLLSGRGLMSILMAVVIWSYMHIADIRKALADYQLTVDLHIIMMTQ